jgi:methyl-accepting chemotaxis protein
MRRRYRRRILLVGSLQYRLLAVTIGHFLVFAALVSVSLFAPLIMQLESGTIAAEQQGQAAAQFLYLHRHFWPALVVIFVFLAFHSIVVSHRIAGPLVNFRRVLHAVGDGDLTASARIRKHDYLREEEASINEMIAGLAARVQVLRDRCGQAGAAWAGLRAVMDGKPADLSARMHDLAAAMVALELAAERFKVPKRPADDLPPMHGLP